MRTDVKLGVFFSMVIVLTLGGYFAYPRGGGEAIPLTGDVQPAGVKSAPTKLASNSKKASQRRKTAAPAKNARTARSNKKSASKSPVPARQRSLPKESSRLADGANRKRKLPVSGASLATGGAAAPEKGARSNSAQGKRGAKTARQPVNTGRKLATKKVTPPAALKRGGQQLAASNLTEKPGTPTPPGLLAATRKKSVPKNEPAVDLHRVQPGDTFATLARAYYGSAKYVEFLMRANPGVDPAKMQVGATIRIPALSVKRNAVTSPVSKQVKTPRSLSSTAKTYTVRSGDSFYRIAEQQLGDASRWKELFELNKKVVGSDPSRLKIGQVLTLPGK